MNKLLWAVIAALCLAQAGTLYLVAHNAEAAADRARFIECFVDLDPLPWEKPCGE